MQTKSNCKHFPNADDICFVCPVVFNWQPITTIPHTFACRVAEVQLGLYDQPSDKSTWITMTGPAGRRFPTEPKKFPNRNMAESWALDTLRLIYMAQPETTMSPTPDEPDTNVPPAEPTTPPNQQPPFDPEKQPDPEPVVPGPDFEPDEDDDWDDEDGGSDDDDLEDD